MNAKLNQTQIIDLLYQSCNLNKQQSEQFVKSFFDIISEALLRGEQVKIKGFGTFKLVKIEDRESINVNTGERILIEGYTKISFVPDVMLKELINRPFSDFENVILTDEQVTILNESRDESADEGGDIEEESSHESSIVAEEITDSQAIVSESESNEIAVIEKEQIEELPDGIATDESREDENSLSIEKSAKGGKQQRRVKPFIAVASILLVLLVGGYMLWPVIIRAIVKHQYALLQVDYNEQNVEIGIEANSSESEDESSTLSKASPKDTLNIVTTEKKSEERANEQKSINNINFKVELTDDDRARELSEFTINDVNNYLMSETYIIHTLQRNERLTLLAQHYYGTKKLWPYIAKYNGISDFNRMRPGMKIKIPKLESKE